MDPNKVILHRDGTVTLWNVFEQSWVRFDCSPSDRVLASMSPENRDKVIHHIIKHSNN